MHHHDRMKRGKIWTVAGGKDYAGKPRPVVIVQDERFDSLESVTVCGFTSDPREASLFRIAVAPTAANGKTVSRLMADKITTVPKARLGVRIGRLDAADMVRLNRAILIFLNLIQT